MVIEKNIQGASVVLALCGRLDTASAPELEETISSSLDGVTDLVLDCGGLEYVSSAGLRVILKAQKIMNGQGSMKLTKVNDSIMEVLEITGFVDILTIE